MKKLVQSILLIASIILISGCGKNDLSLPTDKPKIDHNMPIVDASAIRSIPDMTAIALEWKAIINPQVQGYYIYRSDVQKDGSKLKRITTIDNRYTSHYLDENLIPNTKYMYAISTISSNDTESVSSQSVALMTKKRFESVSFVSAVNELPRQIKILWRPHSNERVEKYIIQRASNKTSKWEDIKTIDSRLKVEYIDDDLGDNEVFAYRVVALTYDGIKSIPSKIVRARTKPLPIGVTNIQATQDKPQKIIINWTAPENTEDIAYYYIYNSDSQDGSFDRLVSIRPQNNSYTHIVPYNNKLQFYKITTVDKDELESLQNMAPAVGKTLEQPTKPIITLAQITNEGVILNWQSSDNRAVSYNIYKSVKSGYFSKDTTAINGITNLRFEDKNITRGVTYEYSIEAVDEFGLKSEQTKSSILKLNELENATPINN
jgi:fibronectin type 3 domain-containing protein